jgi:glycosyltransferase involved in cell wall biosynthesis
MSKVIKLAIISTMGGSPWGGSEELWAALAKETINTGASVAVSAYRWPKLPPKLAELQRMGAQIYQRINPNRLSMLKRALNRVISQIAPPFSDIFSFKPDVICINEGKIYESLSLRGLLPQIYSTAVPYIVICHGNNELRLPNATIRKSALEFFSTAYRVIFVSRRNIAIAERQLAAKLANAQVLQSPLNFSDVSAVPWPVAEQFCMALVGRLEAGIKGHDLLFEILGSPAWLKRQWKLRIYGDGPDRKYLESLAHYYTLAPRIEFMGFVDNVKSIWSSCHLMVMPSRSEALPIALIEAMVCGRPAVVTDAGGISEWVEDGRTGFIAEAASVKSFGAALERAWTQNSALETMGMKARGIALKRVDQQPGKTLLDMVREAAHTGDKKTP